MNRKGFTLVELLVAVVLMLVLAGLAVLFWPGIDASARVSEGASQLQQWLNIAKQRALRDQQPRGLRIHQQGTACSWIESAADLVGSSTFTATGAAGNKTATLSGMNLAQGQVDPKLWLVAANDNLLVDATGVVYRIQAISQSSPIDYVVTLNFGLTSDLKGSFRIIRGARISEGDQQQLPKEVLVDISKNNTALSNADGDVDIMFAPSGRVLSQVNTVIFWVRDVDDKLGSLVVVRANGRVESVELGGDPLNPYQYVEQ